jgi:hypothetical protein
VVPEEQHSDDPGEEDEWSERRKTTQRDGFQGFVWVWCQMKDTDTRDKI